VRTNSADNYREHKHILHTGKLLNLRHAPRPICSHPAWDDDAVGLVVMLGVVGEYL